MTLTSGEREFRLRRFSDDFAQILRERILTGELPSGKRLNEVQLSKEFGISRSPIREAMQVLAGEGLVEVVAGRGAFVGGLTIQEVRDLGGVREALETHAVSIVAGSVDPAGILALDASLDVDDGYRSQDDELDFHSMMLRLAGNPRLEQAAAAVTARLWLARSRSALRPGRIAQARAEHEAILTAIQGSDPLAAIEHMRTHIHRATENACAALATRPED